MMEKMKYINITGHLNDIDRVIGQYISKYEIHFENAARELKKINGLEQINLPNPYLYPVKIAEKHIRASGCPTGKKTELTAEEAFNNIEMAERVFTKRSSEINKLIKNKDRLVKALEMIEPFRALDFQIKDIAKLEYIKYQFGKMPVTNFKQFEAFLYEKPEILFVKGKMDKEYVWGAYFTADCHVEKVESIFSSLHFVKLDFDCETEDGVINSDPDEYYDYLTEQIDRLNKEIALLETKAANEPELKDVDIATSYEKIKNLYENFEMKKYAAQTVHDYYIFVGWMTERDAVKLEAEMERDDKVVFIIEENLGSETSLPPTKLKNIAPFRPFEFFVRMYGLPSYGEFDPTPFVAITYTIIFGLMFGDLGQGLVLSLLGFFLHKKKKMALGQIMSVIGISSMFFGVLYGSVFGFEELIPTIWMKPSENINMILLITVGIGAGLILVSMALNIINCIKNKRVLDMMVDPNGVPGMVFYIALAYAAIMVLFLGISPPAWLIVVFIAVPLIPIAFREPLINAISGKKAEMHKRVSPGMFIMETFIELFEVVLSYLTNTISFVRVGAFALSHAGMMSVVMLLSEGTSGSHNIAVVIIGNILVMALEGLVVAIQVLRLEFYEMFSRFYKGGGREFVPLIKKED